MTQKIDFESQILAPPHYTNSQHSIISFEYVDFLILYPPLENSTTRIAIPPGIEDDPLVYRRNRIVRSLSQRTLASFRDHLKVHFHFFKGILENGIVSAQLWVLILN